MRRTLTTLLFCIVSIHVAFSQDSLQKARQLMNENPLIDGHNDLPYQYRMQWEDRVYENSTNLKTLVPTLQTDIPRLLAGEVGGQFWSVYVDCDHQHKDAVRATMEQIDNVYKFVEKYSNAFQLAFTAADIQNAFENGKIASLMGMEGGHSIDSSVGALRMFYKLGARYMTLTHNCNTPWADSCCADTAPHNGLTYFGQQVVLEMNRIGMMVDISHVSEKTMQDVLDIVQAPVIFSHSNAYALCPTPRNVPDSILEQMEDNGGIVMVNFYPPYVSCANSSTIAQVADHIDYIRGKCGDGCVGIGADYDGVSTLTTGLENVSKYPYLISELIERGYTDEQVTKVIGANLIRVLQQVEDVSTALKGEYPEEHTIYPNTLPLEKLCRTTY